MCQDTESRCLSCSTYYGFCGNAGMRHDPGKDGEIRASVCSKWLHPVRLSEHPTFQGWVIHGAHSSALQFRHMKPEMPSHRYFAAADTLCIDITVVLGTWSLQSKHLGQSPVEM